MRLALALIFLLAAVPGLASAQTDADRQPGSLSEPRHVQTLHRIGACLARAREADTRALLALDFRTDEYSNLMRRINRRHPACADVQTSTRGLRTGGLLLAGSFAEALLQRDSVIDHLGERTAFDASKPTIEARNAGELMAICVVRLDPNGVARLLRTVPASVEELESLRALGPTLSRCVPDGGQARFTREALRAVIALASYRLYRHKEGVAS
jgi:hypothetical protein